MNIDEELLEITKENLEEAQFMAANFIDKDVRNRIFLNVVGSEAFISHVEKFEINTENMCNIHSVKRIIEKIDIADIILDNIRLDVRVVFDENVIFIPKSHYKYGIVPDLYVVLKYNESIQNITLLGYFEPSEINLNNSNENYYFFDSAKLHSPFSLMEFVKNHKGSTEVPLSMSQILRGKELSVQVADNDYTDDEFREFLSLLLKSSELRHAVLEYDNFETLASKVAYALQVKKAKKGVDDSSVVDLDEFMSIDDQALPDNEPLIADDADDNGESLLDDNVTSVAELPIIPDIVSEEPSIVDIIDAENISESLSDGSLQENINPVSMENLEKDMNISEIPVEPVMDSNISMTPDDDSVTSPFDHDSNTFELKEGELDFSDFEEDISLQASEDFIDEDKNSGDNSLDGAGAFKNSSENETFSASENQSNVDTGANDDSSEYFDLKKLEENNVIENKIETDDSEYSNLSDLPIVASENDEKTLNSPVGDEVDSEAELFDFDQISEAPSETKNEPIDDTNNYVADIDVFGDDTDRSNYDIQDDNSQNELVDSMDNNFEEEDISQNSEVNYEIVDDIEGIESNSSLDKNVVDFPEGDSDSDIPQQSKVRENSVAITDKDVVPGEILIDINMDDSHADSYTGNEHLEELYNNSVISDSSGLNNDVRIVPQNSKQIPLAAGLGGIVVVFLIVGVILFSVYKYMNPASKDAPIQQEVKNPSDNNLGSDVPKTENEDKNIVMDSNYPGSSDLSKADIKNTKQKTQQQSAGKSNTTRMSATSYISVRKLSWEVPDYVSYDGKFRQYFQSSGKSLKAALSSDLLLAMDYTYSDVIKVSISFDKSGNFKDSRILSSSGSSQIDSIVLQSVNQTLKALKAPNSLGNDESTTVILKIYL